MATPNQLNSIYTTQSQMSSFFIDNMGILNVKSYGAVGDGVADDTVAITSCIASASGKIIYIPDGTYLISSNIIFNNDIKGVWAESRNATFYYNFEADADIIFTGLTDFFVLNLCAKTSTAVTRDAGSNAFRIISCNRFKLENLKVEQWSGMGIYISNCEYGTVTGCYIENTLADGIHVTNADGASKHIKIYGNEVYSNGDDAFATVGYVGNAVNEDIIIDGNQAYESTGGARIAGTSKAILSNNTFYQPVHGGINVCYDNNVVSGYETLEVDGAIIRNNIIDSPQSASYMGIFIWTNKTGKYIKNVQVDGNIIINSKNSAIRVTAEGLTEQLLWNISIRNNQLLNNSSINTAAHAILINDTKNADVSGNYVYRSYLSGIYADTTNTNLKILNNTFEDCNLSTGAVACIRSEVTSSHICNNTIYDPNTNHAADIQSAATGMFVYGNSTNKSAVGYTFTGTNPMMLLRKAISYSSVIPATGTWIQGDIVYNTAPDSGEPSHWICTVGGTSGTWVVGGQAGYRSGAATPSGAIVPFFIGENYLDSTGVKWYKSTGLTNTDWVALN